MEKTLLWPRMAGMLFDLHNGEVVPFMRSPPLTGPFTHTAGAAIVIGRGGGRIYHALRVVHYNEKPPREEYLDDQAVGHYMITARFGFCGADPVVERHTHDIHTEESVVRVFSGTNERNDPRLEIHGGSW